MEKFHRWVVNHKMWFRILASGIALLYLLFFIWSDATIWIELFTVFFFFLLIISYPNYSREMLMNKAILVLNNQCDPYPLLTETEELLKQKHSELQDQVYKINHCVALRDIGEYEKVYSILSTINIDKFAGMPPVHKIVFYNNLSDICTKLNQYEEANIWHAKMMQLYADLKEGKTKRVLESAILSAEATDKFRAGDYTDVVRMLGRAEPDCLRKDVSDCLLCGRAYLQLGETERAKEYLQVVVDKGNRVYEVIEAKKLLEEI